MRRSPGRGKGQVTFDQVPVEQARDYSCCDSDVTLRLAPMLEKRVAEDGMRPPLPRRSSCRCSTS